MRPRAFVLIIIRRCTRFHRGDGDREQPPREVMYTFPQSTFDERATDYRRQPSTVENLLHSDTVIDRNCQTHAPIDSSVSTMVHVAPTDGEWYKEYRFERTLPPSLSQQECAHVTASQCIEAAGRSASRCLTQRVGVQAAVQGEDSILMVYGPSGSGKSCLLLGDSEVQHMWNGLGEAAPTTLTLIG
jgi:hypothetical protein